MDKLNIQFGSISFPSDNEAASDSSEKATVVHAPRIAPAYLNRLKKMVSDAASPAPVNRKHSPASSRLSEEEKKEQIKFGQVKRKKDFVHYERVNGKKVNVVQGLELHTGVFDAEEQMKIVECIYQYQQLGQKGQLRECNILFGSSLKIVSPGEFSGPVSVPLPKGSVLVLQGNGADVAKHCVPGVPSKRISVTFRKMDESKSPFSYKPDPELLRIQPLVLPRPLVREPSTQQSIGENEKKMKHDKPHSPPAQTTNQNVLAANKEFPSLGSFSSSTYVNFSSINSDQVRFSPHNFRTRRRFPLNPFRAPMDKLNIQFGEMSVTSDSEAPSEKATAVHAPRIAPTYLNRLKKMVPDSSSPEPVSRNQAPEISRVNDNGLSEVEKIEQAKFAQVKRKKGFVHYERVDGKKVNVVQGLELHTGIFDAEEQMKIVDCVYQYQQLGQKGQLRGI
nr:RNA demethylase ALKBH5-like [Ipomoea batatas]